MFRYSFNLRNILSGIVLIIAIIIFQYLGVYMLNEPDSIALTISAATCAGEAHKSEEEFTKPLVIGVFTIPGLTVMTLSPVP